MADQFGLGRRFHEDPRDRSYLLQNRVDFRRVVQRRSKVWPSFRSALDQGATGTCVGHAVKHWLMAAPVIQTTPTMEPTAVQLYVHATHNDEWTGNEGDLQFGTSVRAGMQSARHFGFINEFNWLYRVEDMADWIAGVDADGKFFGGPIIIGSLWYSSMFQTDSAGFVKITPTARIVGGHAYLADHFDVRRGFFSGPNSWGLHFGRIIVDRHGRRRRNGRWRMDGETLVRLIETERGEAATSHEIRKVKTA